MCRGFRQLGNQRDGCCPTTDYDHSLVGVFDVVGPLLRMYNSARELIEAGELGRVSSRIVVVTGTHEQKRTCELDTFRIRPTLYINGPLRALTRPGCTLDLVLEPDVLLDPVFFRRIPHIPENRGTIGD